MAGSNRVFRLAAEGGWIVLGQVVAVVGSLFLVRVLTEYLEPEQYGHLALALTLGTLVCQVSMAGVMPGIMRFYAIAAEKHDLPGYLRAASRLMGIGTVVTLMLGAMLLIAIYATGKMHWFGIVAMAVLFSQLSSYNSSLNIIQNAARQRSIVAFHTGLDPWLKLAVVVVIFNWYGGSETMVIAGYAVAVVMILGSQSLFVRRLISGNARTDAVGDGRWMSQMWDYSKPFAIFNLFTWAQANSDRWALEVFSNTQEVGLFAVLMQLGYAPITMAIGLLSTLIGPILNQRSGDATDPARNADVHRVSMIITAVCLAATVLAFLVGILAHELVFRVLVAEEYRSISYLLPWVLLAGGMFAAGQVLSLKLMSDMRTKDLLWPKLMTSVIGVGLNVVGAFLAGLHGIIAAAIAFSALQLIWLGVLALRKNATVVSRAVA
jgi:O-antigen/teichoic acid export membrane protein